MGDHHIKIKYFVLFLINFLFSQAFAGLENRLKQELENPFITILNSNLEEFSNSYHFVFIGGFLNEGLAGYFNANKRALSDLNISYSEIYPSSRNGVLLNAALIRDEMIKISREVKKPLILIAHSKGGLETLIMEMTGKEWILNGTIASTVFIQSALRGSIGADVLSAFYEPFFDSWNGLQSMRPENTQNILNNILDSFENEPIEAQKKISESIFYVQSAILKNAISPVLKVPSLLLNSTGAKLHDGMILTEDQMVPFVGKSLDILDADHADLVAARPFSNTSFEYRMAFTRALISQLMSEFAEKKFP